MSKLRIAIIYKTEDVFIEFPTSKFIGLLKTYMGVSERSKTWVKIDEAFTKIEKDLKKETKYV